MAKHPAAEHHQKAADKHKAAEESHRRAQQAHEQDDHEAASEHATVAGQHATEAVQHGQKAKDAYGHDLPTRTDLPPEASGLAPGPGQRRGQPPKTPSEEDE